MKRIALIVGYLAAIVAANLITTHYAAEGHPEVSVYTAFGLVAFDMVARDVLHDWYEGGRRVLVLGALILTGSLLAYIANPDSAEIAKWSALAFAAAMIVDSVVYQVVHRLKWMERVNISNVAAAATDSIVFCAGLGFPFIVAFGQFTAKVGGGGRRLRALARAARQPFGGARLGAAARHNRPRPRGRVRGFAARAARAAA